MPKSTVIAAICNQIAMCTQCRNHMGINNTVPGTGNPNAKIMVIGEAPGADEDSAGLPFVGDAGKNLHGILEESGLNRENDLYITNIVKCRPTKQGKKGLTNRAPGKREAQACRHFLLQQIDTVEPDVIVCIGRIAAQMLLETTTTLEKLMSTPQFFNGVLVMPTYHTSDICLNLDSSRRGKILSTFREVKERYFTQRR